MEDSAPVERGSEPPQPTPPRADPRREPEDRFISDLVASLSLEERVGQLIMPALPRGSAGRAPLTVDARTRALIADVLPGGVILFGDNLASRPQAEQLVEGLQAATPLPLIVAIDQEGGVVSRLAAAPDLGATPIPSAARVGRAGDPRLAEELAGVTGRELAALGITMNFAPVADLRTRPDNPVTRSRAFGADPDQVGALVAATVRGLQRENVSAVIKHFPGHGATSADSHDAPAIVEYDLERLLAVEIRPFAAGIAAGADAVMIGHLSVPEITGSRVPATLSAELTTGLLRRRLAFDGVVVTDSLVMGALAGEAEPHRLGVRALAAGADILLLPSDPRAVRDEIVAAVVSGELSEMQLDRSVERVLRLKARRGLLRPPETDAPTHAERSGPVGFSVPERFTRSELPIGSPEHREVVERILERSTP